MLTVDSHGSFVRGLCRLVPSAEWSKWYSKEILPQKSFQDPFLMGKKNMICRKMFLPYKITKFQWENYQSNILIGGRNFRIYGFFYRATFTDFKFFSFEFFLSSIYSNMLWDWYKSDPSHTVSVFWSKCTMSSSSTGLVPPPSSTTTSLESAAAVVVSASANTTSAPEPPSSLNSASSPSSTHW